MSLLKLQNINTGYGKKQVLFDVTMGIEESETVLLIGSNGSGKSTLLKVIYRLLPIWNITRQKSCIEYNNFDILNIQTYQLMKKGVVYIPQQNELFFEMTVKQNLETSALHLKNRKETKDRTEEVLEMITPLKKNYNKLAAQLSGGERKQLSLGMAMMNRPKLLMLDEPLAGVASDRIEQVRNIITRFKKMNTTAIIVEHRIKELFELADRVVGLKLGRMIKEDLSSLEKIKSTII